MTPPNEHKNGGLIALTLFEADRILTWFWNAMLEPDTSLGDADVALKDRIVEWKRRHVPEDAAATQAARQGRARVNTEAMTPTHLVAQPGDRFSLCKIKDPLPSILAKHVDAHRLSRGLVVCAECAARREVL